MILLEPSVLLDNVEDFIHYEILDFVYHKYYFSEVSLDNAKGLDDLKILCDTYNYVRISDHVYPHNAGKRLFPSFYHICDNNKLECPYTSISYFPFLPLYVFTSPRTDNGNNNSMEKMLELNDIERTLLCTGYSYYMTKDDGVPQRTFVIIKTRNPNSDKVTSCLLSCWKWFNK